MSHSIQANNQSLMDWAKTSISLMILLLLSVASIPDVYATEEMSCNCVAFRLDDIQDYFLNNVQIEIIEEFGKNNVTLTVGMIGNYFGEDQKIVSFLKQQLNQSDAEDAL